MLSEKYGRTYHYPFSPGTTSDDRINHTYWEDIQQIETLIHTEKLDGENNCLSRHGVFARSHAAPHYLTVDQGAARALGTHEKRFGGHRDIR